MMTIPRRKQRSKWLESQPGKAAPWQSPWPALPNIQLKAAFVGGSEQDPLKQEFRPTLPKLDVPVY